MPGGVVDELRAAGPVGVVGSANSRDRIDVRARHLRLTGVVQREASTISAMTEGDTDPAGRTQSAGWSALKGLLAVAAVWLTWWAAVEVTYEAEHVEVSYLVVFLGGPIAALITLIVLAVTAFRVVVRIGRHDRRK